VAAKSGKIGDHDLRLCTYALDQDALDSHDRAGTFINRGTLYLKRKAYEDGLKDFDAAVKLGPDIGEAHVNRGAALVGLRRFAEARAELDRGLELHPSEPEKAYFNRATARELLGDVAGAYADYTKAVELAPGWQPPLDELKRFKVEKQNQG
jgi:tetratricopeptide (TPR) repeat protein